MLESTRSEPTWSLETADSALWVCVDGLRLVTACATVDVGGGSRTSLDTWRSVGARWVSDNGGARCQVEATATRGGVVLRSSLENRGASPVTLRRFGLALQAPEGLWDSAQGTRCGLKIGYCGAHSRSPHSRSAVVELDGTVCARSWWVGALAPRRGGPGFVLGGADFRQFAIAVDVWSSGLSAVQFLEGRLLAPGERLDLAPLWLGVSRGAPLEHLELYAAEVGRRHGAVPRESPCGWGSWGHFLEAIDADLMRENLLAIQGTEGLRDAIRVIQVDDGWSQLLETERTSASWLPNRRFPNGIAPLADVVRRRGRDFGLWILPFTVNDGSPLADAHPEYFVQDERGRPMRVAGGASFCLDPCHPGAVNWILDTLGRLRDWGVTYVKLDHVRALLAADPDASEDDLDTPRVHRERVTRVEAYRRGLALVREALGPKVFLLGCSAPAGPSIGLVDAHRVGPDIEPRWIGSVSGIRDATRALAANFFWQGRTWVNDPDYLLAGQTVEESRFWATAVALSGGSAIVSADLSDLPPWQEGLFAMVTPPSGRAARPLDLFENAPEPRLWHLEPADQDSPWHLVGLFNWADQPTVVILPFRALGLDGAQHVWDVWRCQHHMVVEQGSFPVDAHSAVLLALREVKPWPQVVGTDVHFAQGAWVLEDEVWDAPSSTLRLYVSRQLPRPGSAWVWAPGGLRQMIGRVPVPGRSDLFRIDLQRGTTRELRFLQPPSAQRS